WNPEGSKQLSWYVREAAILQRVADVQHKRRSARVSALASRSRRSAHLQGICLPRGRAGIRGSFYVCPWQSSKGQRETKAEELSRRWSRAQHRRADGRSNTTRTVGQRRRTKRNDRLCRHSRLSQGRPRANRGPHNVHVYVYIAGF